MFKQPLTCIPNRKTIEDLFGFKCIWMEWGVPYLPHSEITIQKMGVNRHCRLVKLAPHPDASSPG